MSLMEEKLGVRSEGGWQAWNLLVKATPNFTHVLETLVAEFSECSAMT
jgi:hypothetical protein